MIVRTVWLKNFRNHADTVLDLGDGANLIFGNNGQGKTNILEAISYLSLTKSFYATSDATVVRIGTGGFDVGGVVVTGGGIEHGIRCVYDQETRAKRFTINHTQPETLASVIGRFPVVVLSPENSAITFGGPAERRRFLDIVLSQVSRSYLEDLLEYRRILRQRNKALSESVTRSVQQRDLLEPWSAGLVERGSRIIQRRREFVAEFERYVQSAYRKFVAAKEDPTLEYQSVRGLPPGTQLDEITAALSAELKRREHEEFRRGLTLTGPHRDDLSLCINGREVHAYASQGQHKTFLIALKVAEFFYVRERRSEAPLVLLDDVFSELDAKRSETILDLLAALGQTIITATDDSVFHHNVEWGRNNRKVYVENGTCRPG
jgi:DNA replication and repair protein RecF